VNPMAVMGIPGRKPFFTPRSLADYLNVSERTVRQLIAERRIASYRVGGARRIDPADVDRFLERGRDA
jgi:excisionase family DNA binding protein